MDSQTPSRVLQKRRTTNFREDETKLLIQLWGSPQIQNKLYLTHRKAPVMRLLAANMQHRGFYRTPDEIKTRLRNLKCLYHRIKRSVQSGVGIGTVDPDWPHYKAMDEILNKKNSARQDLYRDNIFEGPRCEDIKQELMDEEIDINDDMDSYTTNSVNESDAEFEEDGHMPPLTPAPPTPKEKPEEPEPVRIAPKPIVQQKVVQPSSGLQIPVTTSIKSGTNGATLPFPLLILNGLSNQAHQTNGNSKKDGIGNGGMGQEDVSILLKNIFEVQKEHLELEKQRLEMEREKLEFHRLVGSRLLTMFGSMLEKLTFPTTTNNNNNNIKEGLSEDEDPPKKMMKQGIKRRMPDSDQDVLKDSKILRNVLEDGIKKYMMGEGIEDSNDNSDIVKKEAVDKN
ncbi:unnamed protein product [Phaedon cochleariae]|uniref:Myb/SANT-like DNA-binding domain-containing protein n=1 Tax=Phaedon cochleariae TaxID=80249 RepID=A0A9P0DBI8_PHACE|nr:unnamed protein product [Phaedon cochleariae]